MRPPGRPPLPAFVMMGPITTFLRRCWSHHDVQVTAGRAFGLGWAAAPPGLAVASFAAAEAAEAGRQVRGRRRVRPRIGRLPLVVRLTAVRVLTVRVPAVRV